MSDYQRGPEGLRISADSLGNQFGSLHVREIFVIRAGDAHGPRIVIRN